MREIRVTATPVEKIAARVLTGITAGMPVLTLDGKLPVQYLCAGDRIITRAGARILREVAAMVLRDAQMIRIRANAFGGAPDTAARPEHDMFLTPVQPIVIRGRTALDLLGVDRAIVPAGLLANGDSITQVTVAEVRLFTLRFDREEVIYAGSLELGCPSLGCAD